MGGVDVQIHIFLTSALVGCEWSPSRPDRFTPGTHWVGGWMVLVNKCFKGKKAVMEVPGVNRKLPSSFKQIVWKCQEVSAGSCQVHSNKSCESARCQPEAAKFLQTNRVEVPGDVNRKLPSSSKQCGCAKRCQPEAAKFLQTNHAKNPLPYEVVPVLN
jgi:hypothetical protein